jgi:two-component system, sensor histidine kinase LadS
MFLSLLGRAGDSLCDALVGKTDRYRVAFLFAALFALCACPGTATSGEYGSGRAISESGLDYEIAVFADDTGRETIDSIAGMSPSQFRKLNGSLSAGYTRKAHWLRIAVRRGAGSPSRWLLELGPGYLDDVRLFTPESGHNAGFRERRSGDLLPLAARDVVHRHFVFRMDLPQSAAPYTFYLRLQSTSTLMAHIKFWEESQFMAELPAEYLVLGAFLGLFCLMLVYSATYWYVLRERYLILFVALVFSMLIAYFGTNGLAEEYLFPMHPKLANLFAPIGSCLLVFFGFWFFLDFLQVRQRHPWLSKAYVATMFLSLIAIPGAIFDYYVEIAPLLMLASLFSLPLCLVVAWRSIGLDILGSRWVASAYAWYCVMVGSNLVSVLGFATSQKFMVFGWQYGAPIYVIFLMSGVLTRAREMERRRDQAIANSISAEARADIAHAQREEKSKFLSLMAHELKTPLAEIDAAVQALGYAYTGQEPDVQRRHHRIREAVSRLNALLEDSLAVVRNETESNAPFFFRPSRVALAGLWRTLQTAYATSKFDSVRFNTAPTIEFTGDSTLLRFAIGNLLDNALKYGVADQPVTVSVREQLHSNRCGIAFEVASAFAGTVDEDFEVWFEKFSRGKGSVNKEGVGLGLYLVRLIADAHGGGAYCYQRSDDCGAFPTWIVATLWIPLADNEGEGTL